MANGNPFTLRNFGMGRYAQSAINTLIAPANSVKNSLNIYFDYILGSAVVRPGTTRLGANIATPGLLPEGLATFLPGSGSGLGNNLVVNGTFTGSAASWSLGPQWTYNSNNVIFTP